MSKTVLQQRMEHPIFYRALEKSKIAVQKDIFLERQLNVRFEALGFTDATALSQRVRLEKELITYNKACVFAKERSQINGYFKLHFDKEGFMFCLLDQWHLAKDTVSKRLIEAVGKTYGQLAEGYTVHLDIGLQVDRLIMGTQRVYVEQGSLEPLLEQAQLHGQKLGAAIVKEQLGAEPKMNTDELEDLKGLQQAYAQSYGHFLRQIVPGSNEQARGLLWDQTQFLQYADRAVSRQMLKKDQFEDVSQEAIETWVRQGQRKVEKERGNILALNDFLIQLGV